MPTILVVDDDDAVRAMIEQMLTRAGYPVRTATNGVEALESFRREPADLVVLDIVMPEKEGLETIIELRRDFPHVKIIAVSGGGRVGPQSYIELAEKFGAQKSFNKPIRRQELLAAVEELVGS